MLLSCPNLVVQATICSAIIRRGHSTAMGDGSREIAWAGYSYNLMPVFGIWQPVRNINLSKKVYGDSARRQN